MWQTVYFLGAPFHLYFHDGRCQRVQNGWRDEPASKFSQTFPTLYLALLQLARGRR